MSAALAEIRSAMATAMTAVPALQTSPYVLSQFSLPCAMVLRGPVEYDQAMQQGVHIWDLNVRVYVADLTDIGASLLLDRLLDPAGDYSIKTALETDTSLGGLVSDLHVTGSNGEQAYVRQAGGPLLGSEFQVTVWL